MEGILTCKSKTNKLLEEGAAERGSLWDILLRIIRALEQGLDVGCTHFYVQIHCKHGRHRSVATCLLFAKMLEARLLGIYTEVHMAMNNAGLSKMCNHGTPCPHCRQGASWLPPLPVLDLLLDKLRTLTKFQQGRRSRTLDAVANLIACGTIYRSRTSRYIGEEPHRWSRGIDTDTY